MFVKRLLRQLLLQLFYRLKPNIRFPIQRSGYGVSTVVQRGIFAESRVAAACAVRDSRHVLFECLGLES